MMRRESEIFHSSQQAITTKTLHTVTDNETLVRMRVQLKCTQIFASALKEFGASIAVAPGSSAISINNPALSEDLDSNVSEQLLLRLVGVSYTQGTVLDFELDSKAMRKLHVGDTILWKDLCTTNDSYQLAGVVTMWFKQ